MARGLYARGFAAFLAIALGAGGGCVGSIDPEASPGTRPSNRGAAPGPGAPGPAVTPPGGPPPGTGPVIDPGGPPLPPVGMNELEPDRRNPVCATVSPGVAPLRRLTRAEFDNTVRDLVGEDKKLAQGFPPEELHAGFDNDANVRSVSDLLAEGYVAAAEQVGKAVAGKLATLLACDPSKMGPTGEAMCLDRFLDGFAKRAWRRPLDATEREDLKKVFAAGRTATFADGIDAVVQVMLLSPQFLYRVERGVSVAGASHGRLTHWEMASRLSYLLWGTMPDAELFAAAEAGKLGTRDEVMAQAKRLIADGRATEMVTRFGSQWLQLRELAEADKDPKIFPRYTDDLLGLWRQEAEGFVAEVWKTDAKLDTLLAAPWSVMNGKLAALYGVAGVTGDAFRRVPLDASQRAGVLTLGGLLAAKSGPDQTSPVFRGVFVREQMFCAPLPPPPPDVDANPPALNPRMTTRERFAEHRKNPACGSCHNLIDSAGMAFENYDAIGLFRTMENGKPVDASGELVNTDVGGAFTGAVGMGKRLVASKQVEVCMASHWFNFGLGRDRTPQDECTGQTLERLFASSDGDLKVLLLALTQSDAFFFKGGLQ